ncbi:hypothetical protein Tco_0894501 [Tanacetum coccineum]|uniref:Uncharacterized protein n=1 Tax=Tanacetum coccineum TaxID=301880 RepID=A0ABQ5CI80_9ASTR
MEMKDTLSSCSNSEEQQMQQIQDKAKKSCMVSFRQLHSHLKLLSNNDLKGTRTESGFKRAFATLFGQDIETFTGTMFLYVDQLEKQLDKKEFQEIGSMASLKVLETQFQMFIKSQMYLFDEFVVMTRNYFLQYTQLAIPEFRDTLIQHMEFVKKSIDERAKHKEEYNSWVNEIQMQTIEDKVDSSKELDASLVDTESSGTALKEQDTSNRLGNDAHADDADIRPIYDEEPMAEVQTTAQINVFATGQQHTEQPEFNNEGEVDQNAEQCHDTCPLPATLTDNQTTELSNQSLESENIRLKKTVAQFQKDFLRMEAHCVNLELDHQSLCKVVDDDGEDTALQGSEHNHRLVGAHAIARAANPTADNQIQIAGGATVEMVMWVWWWRLWGDGSAWRHWQWRLLMMMDTALQGSEHKHRLVGAHTIAGAANPTTDNQIQIAGSKNFELNRL